MPQVSPADREGGNERQPIIASREVLIPPLGLAGTLNRPDGARAMVIFAHGSGSSRFSPRNNRVAEAFNRRGIATLLFDLLLPEEEGDRRNVFDINLLARRLTQAVLWVVDEPDVGNLRSDCSGRARARRRLSSPRACSVIGLAPWFRVAGGLISPVMRWLMSSLQRF